MFAVNIWSADPELCEDFYIDGKEFESIEEAMKVYNDPMSYFSGISPWEYVEIYGDNINQSRKIDSSAKKPREDYWKREIAMEAGMCLGVGAYNEVFGWD